jgi:hypothetical protein
VKGEREGVNVVDESCQGCSCLKREAERDALLTGEVRRDALRSGKAGRFDDLANSNIVPFVCGLRETKPKIVYPSHGDEIHSWVESVVEIALIVAGVVGVVASVIAI